MWTSKITKLFCITLFLHNFFTTPCMSSELCNPNDKAVLLQIGHYYNFSEDSSWYNDIDCCKDWYGVECNETTNRVNKLALFGAQISGEILSLIGDLSYLETLIIRKLPNITGPIPNAIAKLKNLRFLALDWNSLSGPVPSFLGRLTKLTYLNLSFNKFFGSIPPSLSHLSNMQYIDLSRNQFTGSIPESFGSFKHNDFYLLLSHNMLSGPIPTSLQRVDFTTIDLSRNQLIGDGSFLFPNNNSWASIDLSRNMLEFNMSKLEFGSGIISIDLSHNKIYGNVPSLLGDLTDLGLLNVSYNRLCGQIPTQGKLGKFDKYSYLHNQCLCGGPLPPCK